MSTILKALQRLEDEKSASSERSLNEQVAAHRPPPAPERRRGLKIGAFAIGGLAVAAAALFFWPNQEEPDAEVAMESPPAATAPAVEATPEVAAKKPRRRRSARPAPAALPQPEPSAIEISPVIEVVKHLDASPADTDAFAHTDASADTDTPAAPPNSAAQRAKAKPGSERPYVPSRAGRSKTQVARGAEQPRSTSKQIADPKPPAPEISGSSVPATPASAPPAPVEIAAVAPKPVPTAALAPIPAATREPENSVLQRAKIPALRVEKTIWHPDVDRRVAVVRLADAEEVLRLKEGDAVGPLVVIDISPGSVLFNHENIEVRYNVGG